MLKSLEKSQRLTLPHYHQEQEMNKIKVTVFQSQNCSFTGIVLNLPGLWETNTVVVYDC